MADPIQNNTVPVLNPEGELGYIPGHQLQDALSQGYTQASPDDISAFQNEQKYGSPFEQAKTFGEGATQGATFGLSTGVERALGVNPEDIRHRAETNPVSHALGEISGIAGSSLVPGVGEGQILNQAGHAVQEAIPATNFVSKIGSMAAKNAVETMMVQSGDEVAKMLASDPDQSAETAATNIGLSGLIGGAIGGTAGAALGSINPLWKATGGEKLNKILGLLTDKTNGTVSTGIQDALGGLGAEISPEIKAGLSDNPELQGMFKTLQQSDTTNAGRSLQENLEQFHRNLEDQLVTSLGQSPEKVSSLSTDLSKYEVGKTLGDTLASEFEEKVKPLANEFDELHSKYANKPLTPDAEAKFEVAQEPVATVDNMGATVWNTPEPKIETKVFPGTASQIAEKISELAQREGWTISPSSEIMREVNRVMKELPNLKTLSDLADYTKSIGVNMQSNPLNKPLIRAGSLIKGILKDAEADTAMEHLGNEAPDLIERYKNAREGYRIASQIKDEIDSRLHTRSSTAGFASALREMATGDGEKVLQRLSGSNDADLLNVLQQHFPKTAEALKQYHIDQLLKTATEKAKGDALINSRALIRAVGKMSPEMREFAIPEQALFKMQAADTILGQLDKMPHNFSNTARTMDRLFQYVPGSALGLATMLTGHNPALGLLLGSLVKPLAKDAPDATRLALLKFIGSNKTIDAGGFKAAVDYIHSIYQGERLATKAIKSIFDSSSKTLPKEFVIAQRDRDKLDRAVATLQSDPERLTSIGGKTDHYLPDHQVALGAVSSRALNYLANIRPNTERLGVLNETRKASGLQQLRYNRQLNIAEQPLLILDHIKRGTLTPQDIQTVSTIYPNLYSKLSTKVLEQMTDYVSRGNKIPHQTAMSLSLFLGEPLKFSLTPQSIMMNQSVLMGNKPSEPTQPMPRSPRSSKALTNFSNAYQTPSQQRELARAK